MSMEPKQRDIENLSAVREKSKNAVRSLLEEAQKRDEQGVSERLSAAKIQDAKDYWVQWRKAKKEFKHPLAAAMIAALFVVVLGWPGDDTVYQFYFKIFDETNVVFLILNKVLNVLALSAIWGATTYIFEEEGTRTQYIRSMVGDLSGMPGKDRVYYVEGLAAEVFNNGKEMDDGVDGLKIASRAAIIGMAGTFAASAIAFSSVKIVFTLTIATASTVFFFHLNDYIK